MIELDFFYPLNDPNALAYQLICFDTKACWKILLDGELLGSFEKQNNAWKKLTGEWVNDDFIVAAGNLIDAQAYNRLPNEICTRWEKQIAEVIAESDHSYLVICKPDINFAAFTKIFSRFIPGLLKDEWKITFKIYSHDFNEDLQLVTSMDLRQERAFY